MTDIGKFAFSGCSSLTSIVIPNSVTNIGDAIFGNCENLNSIKVLEGNSKYDSRDDCNAIIETSLDKIVQSCNATVIPESVTSIGHCAFYENSISDITIPSSVISIDMSAFYGCKNLTNIIIPESVNRIGSNAFSVCASLKSVTMPEGITDINERTFDACSKLETVTMGKNVTSIWEYAFRGCDSLTTINYTGAQEDWSKIKIESGNDNLQNATINYNYTK